MKMHKPESGQAIVIITLVILGLTGFTALVIDVGALYAKRRAAQNAADNASLAGAYAICKGKSVSNAVFGVTTQNGFLNSGPNNIVSYSVPPTSGASVGDSSYVEVFITADVPTSFAHLVYSGPLVTTVRSVSHCTQGFAGGLSAPIVALSETCTDTVNISASNLTVVGGVDSNNDIKISGSDNVFDGEVNYVSEVVEPGSNNTFNPPPEQTTPIDDPVGYSIDDYAPGGVKAQQAASAGHYYYCDCKIDSGWLIDQGLYDPGTKILAEGLYFADNNEIVIGEGDLRAEAATLVASLGKINISGSNVYTRPYIDGLLAFTDLEISGSSKCGEAVITISGSTNDWGGVVYAPNGMISMSGSANTTLRGALIGNTVVVSGQDINIEFEPSYLPVTSDVLDISE